MQKKDDLLSRIRAALGRSVGQPPAPLPPPRLRIPEMSVEARIERFFKNLENLAGKTLLASSLEEARCYVAQLIGEQPAVASNAPLLRECGITDLPTVRSGFACESDLRAACASAAFGITSADYALADTGTLVLFSSPEEARMVSLLPPVHVAVVPRGRILTGLDELLTEVPLPADRSSSMLFITGPSRTADIEQILVRGVHGPGEIHVIVV
ncbi:MAG TPA: lactate utilization protein [Bryobacteraceae bacterium]|nr:lactate utilization protein [Bryobacteraceae bacterium]HOQ45158.1 lactate utilization protein [Bryobacteraceae bacterium]HPQ16030.1 lactate utilization protein [Bryobacteraceae bacterium]HPU71230.1 lactate utilization protein [Bryobacteraceae bacterium]